MAEPTPEESIIPGLSPQGEAVLRMVVREEVLAALHQSRLSGCEVCPRMDLLEHIVLGRLEHGELGLLGRIAALESTVTTLRRIFWISLTALAGSSVSLIIGIFFGK
jgi:hypothetical protein